MGLLSLIEMIAKVLTHMLAYELIVDVTMLWRAVLCSSYWKALHSIGCTGLDKVSRRT